MAQYAVVVDHQGNLREVFGVELGDPVEDFALHRFRILIDSRYVVLVVSHAVALAPLAEAVAVDERGVFRIVELLGEGCDELLVVALEDRVLRHRGLAVGVFRLRHRVFGSGIVDELGRIGALVTSVHHNAESDGEFQLPGFLNQFVNLRIGVFPSVLPVCGIQHGPFRADIAGRSVVRHPYVLSEQRYVDLLVEIGGIVVRADIHHPAVERVVQHFRLVVGGLYGHTGNLAAFFAAAVVLRATAGSGAKKCCQKTAGHQISHVYHVAVFTIDCRCNGILPYLPVGRNPVSIPIRQYFSVVRSGVICSGPGSFRDADRRSAGRKRGSCNTSCASLRRRLRAVRPPCRESA